MTEKKYLENERYAQKNNLGIWENFDDYKSTIADATYMMMMKNTIAKLLAEEDIFVVHKQMETAYFDVKNRELGLPIWKENTMEAVEEELLVCHEIGHALYTPLDMLENSKLRKIDHSVVNVLEDARIEKKVKNKYLGTVRLFNAGYASLIKKDFFDLSISFRQIKHLKIGDISFENKYN